MCKDVHSLVVYLAERTCTHPECHILMCSIAISYEISLNIEQIFFFSQLPQGVNHLCRIHCCYWIFLYCLFKITTIVVLIFFLLTFTIFCLILIFFCLFTELSLLDRIWLWRKSCCWRWLEHSLRYGCGDLRRLVFMRVYEFLRTLVYLVLCIELVIRVKLLIL